MYERAGHPASPQVMIFMLWFTIQYTPFSSETANALKKNLAGGACKSLCTLALGFAFWLVSSTHSYFSFSFFNKYFLPTFPPPGNLIL